MKLQVSHDGDTVTVYSDVSTAIDPDAAFDAALEDAHHILKHFERSQPGSVWGCDGIGYYSQKRQRIVLVHKSGIGPRKFQHGIKTARRCGCLS